MTSKDQILSRIRKHTLPEAALPDLEEDWIRFADCEKQFVQVLESVGGLARVATSPLQLSAVVAELECLPTAKRIVSLVPEFERGNVDLDSIADPHELADIDLAVVPGEFAVAENGAVWVAGAKLRHRALPFIAQHLALVVPRASIVNNLHEAYRRITFEGSGYGVFISGPSKTADIEQSLVIGAHGPRSLLVILHG